jgi:pimeloyl-ACP methyl ester carboxylesterase
VRFHVQRMGAGARTVVFLHGLVMDNLSSWYFTVANPVAKECAVLLYDLRGHGRSERPKTGYTVADMVADLAGILEEAGIDQPVDLVGNSFGGLLALAFASAHPERVSGVVLVDAHTSDEGWGLSMAETLGLEGEERDKMIAESFQSWLGRHSERKRNRVAQVARELVYDTSLVRDLRDSPPFSTEALQEITCPVLAIYGERSDVRTRGEWLASVLPDCQLRLLDGCTHSVLWEATDVVRQAVLRFVGRSV